MALPVLALPSALDGFVKVVLWSLGFLGVESTLGMVDRWASGISSAEDEIERLGEIDRRTKQIAKGGLLSQIEGTGRELDRRGRDTSLGIGILGQAANQRSLNLIGGLAQGRELPNQQAASADDPDVITGAADESVGASIQDKEALIRSTQMPRTPAGFLSPTPTDAAAIKARLAVFINPEASQALA